MQTLYMVIDDVYDFMIGMLGSLMRFFVIERPVRDETFWLPSPTPHEQLEAPKDIATDTTSTFRSFQEVLSTQSVAVPHSENHAVMYAGSVDVPLYKNPTQEFDGVLGIIPYGRMVMSLGSRGKWMEIVYGDKKGWVLREDLVDRAAYVYPEFVIGEKNELDDPNTVRIRAMIGDEFDASRVEFPLQAGEYVLYRLLRKGLTIAWPDTRPRVPGVWHTILRGVLGVHIGITPKTGSIMEYTLPEETGHLAYIEAVFPDETINISEANYPDSGIYNERVLTREEWRELKPIFIQVA